LETNEMGGRCAVRYSFAKGHAPQSIITTVKVRGWGGATLIEKGCLDVLVIA
jgi:hypothetical protein